MMLARVMVLACVMVITRGMVLTMTSDGQEDAGICGSCGLCAYSWMCGCGSGWKSHPHYPRINICKKIDIFWARSGSAWLYFQFWVPKISLLFILSWFYPSSGIQVQNHNNLVKTSWFFLLVDTHLMRNDAHQPIQSRGHPQCWPMLWCLPMLWC